MRLYISLLIILILNLSCIYTGKIDCSIKDDESGEIYSRLTYNTSDFSEEEQFWISESAQRWNDFANHKIISAEPDLDNSDKSCTILNTKLTGSIKGRRIVAYVEQSHKNINFDVELVRKLNIYVKDRFETLLMHEMGHVLGFGHLGSDQIPEDSNNVDALMSWAGGIRFTELDWNECLRLNICMPVKE